MSDVLGPEGLEVEDQPKPVIFRDRPLLSYLPLSPIYTIKDGEKGNGPVPASPT